MKSVIAVQPNGDEFLYRSIAELLSGLGLKPPTVNRALKTGLPITRGIYKGWSFKYVVTLDNPPKEA